jgi:hypothetical protein
VNETRRALLKYHEIRGVGSLCEQKSDLAPNYLPQLLPGSPLNDRVSTGEECEFEYSE